MNLSRHSLGVKIWTIVLGLIVSMLMGGGMLALNASRADREANAAIVSAQKRIELALIWKSLSQLALERVIVSAMTTDEELSLRLKKQLPASISEISEIYKQISDQAETSEDKRLLDRITSERRALLKATALSEESRGDIDATKHIVDEMLTPAARKYVASLEEFVAQQKRQSEFAKAEGAKKRDLANKIAIALLICLLLVGTLLIRRAIRSITASLSSAVDLAEAIQQGNLDVSVDSAAKDETGLLLRSLSLMAEQLRNAVKEIRSGVESISVRARHMAEENQNLSARIEETAANLQETAASMDELTSTVRQNLENARRANEFSTNTTELTGKGSAAMEAVIASMNEISNSSKQVTHIVSLIEGIAFKTNILALNAAVEAAQAGVHGHGFAVVASEVRALAQSSATAAKEVKTLISLTVEQVGHGTTLAVEAGKAMSAIDASSGKVTELIGQIATASNEQATGLEQINQAVMQMDNATQKNAALVEEAAAVAQSIANEVVEVQSAVSSFRLGRDNEDRRQVNGIGTPTVPGRYGSLAAPV